MTIDKAMEVETSDGVTYTTAGKALVLAKVTGVFRDRAAMYEGIGKMTQQVAETLKKYVILG